MEHTITIKRAGIEEAALAAQLLNEYRIFYGQASDVEGARLFIEGRIEQQQSVIWLALEQRDNEVIPAGFTQLYPSFSSISMQPIWILNDLYVNPAYRGSGVGRRLMVTAHQFAQQTGAKKVVLSTATDNTTAQHLYESLGYIRDEHYYNYELMI
ncbi:GNAT family N-acetyltransferase [Paenibacillus sp. 481]|uniref:GNAT family N-acetyltransferase n=1 Tax=Paenibacillus sp. 481 TaxID=2835869 RepID=UPI001E460F2C|nr:GNAT family N-acetyltransferase [Paenibacillus sp. 481]UHA72777.1 GNAT family N-acetyltransferase [Paenibacillus sp. 481]